LCRSLALTTRALIEQGMIFWGKPRQELKEDVSSVAAVI
jgi:hypothetical protein